MSRHTRERAFYFSNREGKNLFGFIHVPSRSGHRKNKAILICHPIFEERIFSYLFLVNFAREACRRGYHVFRFDYYGYGDSEGEAGEVTVNSMLNDIEDAYAFFVEKNQLTDVCLLGYRFGATLAALFAEKHPDLRCLALWDPVVSASTYIKKALRQTISMQTVLFKKILVNREEIIQNIQNNKPTIINKYDLATVDGYPLGKIFFKELVAVDLKTISWHAASIYLAALVQPKRKISTELDGLCTHLENCTNLSLDIIEESVFFWKDNVQYKNTSVELFSNCLHWLDSMEP